MGRLGFEPRTNRLKAECSTAELATLAGCLSSAYTKQRFYLVLSACIAFMHSMSRKFAALITVSHIHQECI